ncbi:winged helix DNA-binding domain-containing protein [Nocardioides sp. YIM 152315]|uniref:winged helix DNA-binding domain-containing protein n=1 Tax=Nocardioides sp. YIM 152315 TaxID=3031760 RepID=UPI0023DA0320|nr:winged helix DNA-binding domain-containing protein [Nocardioides sp. YIM 152315]MDF1606397.1 winged helix DNA-binding domain-containing protein [Nocardioides sp. YIM 152315]
MSEPTTVSREQVLRFRVAAQQLDREGIHGDAAILDLGVQDTGPDGAAWALAIRGAELPADDLVLAWTLRGAPHAYRRPEAAQVAAAVAPWSEADASKRIFDAARQLKKAGIPVLDALDHIAGEMRDIAATPVVKGDLSAALTERLDDPYLRWCNPCRATHTYEQPFRLAGLQAGLELEPGTSPPVLHRIPRWRGAAKQVPEHLDPVRAVLRFLGPATPKLVAGYVDSTVRDVRGRWPEDVVPVEVDGVGLDVLAADLDALTDPPPARGVRLLGPFDLFLQGRDRELVVPDEAARKDLWRTLGRPGGVLVDGEVVGSWRPRSRGRKVQIAVTVWDGSGVPDGVEEQAERLAAFRGQAFSGFSEE